MPGCDRVNELRCRALFGMGRATGGIRQFRPQAPTFIAEGASETPRGALAITSYRGTVVPRSSTPRSPIAENVVPIHA
jgi:hypothetical protein